MLYTLKKNQSGSVVVMAIILTAGILVASVEFAIYAVNSLRQARNVDSSIVAYYTAETAAERTMYQIRQLGATTPNPTTDTIAINGKDATWVLDTSETFKTSSDILRLTRLGKYQSIVVPLYFDNGYTSVTDIQSMKVSWENQGTCDPEDTVAPWIQARAATWTGDSSVQWDDSFAKISNIKEYVKTPSEGAPAQVIFNDVTVNPDLADSLLGQDKPMVLQITSLYCDLYGVNIEFYDGDSGTGSAVAMSNMYTIAPQADYQGVRQQLHITLPAQSGISSLFNYVLFSEAVVQK
ncbi:MAG: hypothetical protein Q8P11_02760 [bacterium]|nr:hypothetical protein [bacterium]